MHKKLLSFALIAVILNSVFFPFVYAEQLNEGKNKQISLQEEPVPEVPSTTFACVSESLSAEEVQRFHNLLATGFEGESFNAGTDPVRFREGLDNNTLVIPAIQEEGQDLSEVPAIKQDLPNQKISPNEVSYLLNNYYPGAFAFGLEINDDLRVGQCKDSSKACYLTEGGLAIRNDGEGFVEDYENIGEDLKKLFESEDPKFQLSEEQKAVIADQLNLSSESGEPITGKKITRTKNIPIQNSIKTDNFTASNATDCNNGVCTITIYSLFDKYFNSWFSTEMVVGNFGPLLIGKAGRVFNWFGNRGITIDTPLKEMEKRFNKLIYGDGTLSHLGGSRLKNSRVLENKYDLKEIFSTFYAQRKTLSDAGIHNTITDWTKADGLLTKIGQDVDRRKAAFQLVNERYAYMNYNNTLAKEAEKIFAASPHLSDDVVDYGQKIAKQMKAMDDDVALNLSEAMITENATGLRKYAIYNEETKEFVPLIDNPRQWDKLRDEFSFSGTFNGLQDKLRLSPAGDVQLFKIADDAVSVGTPISVADLELAVAQGKYVDVAARLTTGEIIQVTPNTIQTIRNASQGGTVQLVKASWDEANPLNLTTQDYSERVLEWIPSRINKAEFGTGQIRLNMVEKGWESRRFTSYLDYAITRENEIIKNYFSSLKGGVKWTAIPYLYWGAKRGAGIEGVSAYQLPDTWYQVELYTDTDPIFDDAFIDFFSNSGSDQGDIFIRVINNLPWKFVLNEAVERFNVLEDFWDKVTKNELRSRAGNLAVYTSGPNDCESCGLTVSSSGGENFTAAFHVDQTMQSFILEDTPEKEKEKGQTIISYAHHMNIKGNSEEAQPIDLAKAIREKNTCEDKLEEAFFGWTGARKLGSVSGGVLAAAESAGYIAFGLGGVIGSAFQQLVIAPELQDCVDVVEGYYTHFFIPEQVEQKKVESGTEKATQKVSDLVKKGTDQTLELLKGGNVSEEALRPVKESVEELTGRATEKRILEAIIKMNGLSSGRMNGIYLFSFWVQGGTDITPTEYKTSGEKNIVGADGSIVNVDFGQGTITHNGQPVITSEDHVRLSSTNTAVPAEEIPNTITRISLPDSEEIMFEMGTNSEMIVVNDSILDCLKDGVLKQTGLELKTNNLSEAFGKTLSVVTDTHPNIYVQGNKIIAEGLPRKIGELNPKVQIKMNRKTSLIAGNVSDLEVGLMKSIQFKNGFILYKPETNELLIWLKHHEDGVIAGNDVIDLKPILTKTVNPLTGCEETAFDLKIAGNPDSPFIQSKVEQFNTSLKHLGPYQIFDTETHRYVFYTDEECNERMKIINKETGEVYDQPISSLKQTANGFNVTTADGRNHDFNFGVDNGQPFIDYNGLREILRSAAGRNGSFYYDPNKGLFYAENAQMLPLNEAFKQQGINTKANPDGTVSSTAGGNPLNINIGQQGGSPISLPSFPENAILLVLMIAVMFSAFLFVQFRIK